MASNYQPLIPTGTVFLDQDYANIQGNFQQLDTTFGVDHLKISNTTAQNGYHTAIHMVPQSTPATTPGYGILYDSTINDSITTDQELFFKTGGGLNLQLTRNFLPTASANGATFLPGGLILNWGSVTLNQRGTVTVVTFTRPFPSSVFCVTVGLVDDGGNSPNTNNVYVKSGTLTNSGFSFTNTSASALNLTTAYWMAIGK